MVRGTEKTFLQRRYTDGQHVHRKIFNVANHQGKYKLNHNEISPHTCQNSYLPKRQGIKSAGKDGRKENFCALLEGMQIILSTMENSMEVPQKLKIKLPYYPGISLLGIYSKK